MIGKRSTGQSQQLLSIDVAGGKKERHAEERDESELAEIMRKLKGFLLSFSTEIEEPLAGVRPFDRYVTREWNLGDI